MELIFWTISLICIGLISVPWSIWWGGNLAHKGGLISTWWGIIVMTLSSWLLGHTSAFPLTQYTLWILVIFWAGINYTIIQKSARIRGTLRTHIRPVLLTQLVGLIPFFLCVFVRGFNPAIDNFEKFMDMNFMHASYQTTSLPVQDTWFAGRSINYYYFGHYTIATIAKFSGVRPAIAYNFGIATIFASSWVLAYTIGATVFSRLLPKSKKSFSAGIITAMIVTVGGTLYSATFLRVSEDQRFYWFYRAIRLIPSAIHEFPGYSFAVADLHAHLLNIPVVLLMIAVTIVTIDVLRSSPQLRPRLLGIHAWIAGVILGVIFMTSAWDLPIYAGFFGICVLFTLCTIHHNIPQTLRQCLYIGTSVILGFIPTITWFWIHFDHSIAQGIGLVHAHTSLVHLGILWGPHLVVIGTLILVSHLYRSTYSQTFWWNLFAIIAVWGGILILIPELIYIKDIYGADLHRLNTILKFYYQAYIILGLLLGIGFVALWESGSFRWQLLCRTAVLILITPILCFPLQIFPEYYAKFQQWQGFDGSAFLHTALPNDATAIAWIAHNTPPSAVIVEAAGDSYSEYARLSTFTGRPTIIGWNVHEWLWRGSYDVVAQRNRDVETIYTTTLPAQRRALLNTYGVSYIYIGQLELRKYPTLSRELLRSEGKMVWSDGTAELIAVDPLKKD